MIYILKALKMRAQGTVTNPDVCSWNDGFQKHLLVLCATLTEQRREQVRCQAME